MEAAYDVIVEALEGTKKGEAAAVARAEEAEAAFKRVSERVERAEAAAKSMEAAYDVRASTSIPEPT